VDTRSPSTISSERLADESSGSWLLVLGMYVFRHLAASLTFGRSLDQLGATFSELFIPPPTSSDPYPPYPAEVDDEFIYQTRIDPQPPGLISKLTGFNMGIKIYMSLTPLATLEMCYGIDEVFDWNRQKKVLEDCLGTVKSVLDNIPRELQLKPSMQPGQFESSAPQYFPPMADYPGARSNGNEMGHWDHESAARRSLQFEIQKANIYASQLGTRSYIVEKYSILQEAFNHARPMSGRDATNTSPGAVGSGLDRTHGHDTPTSNHDDTETNVANEREIIVKDLLRVLGSISQVNMEPNGGSFVGSPFVLVCLLVTYQKYRLTRFDKSHQP
jgi:hypothetical protein